MLAYTVTGDFDDAAVADAWVAWLGGGHVQAVLAAGALSAEVLRLSPGRVEVRYRFADRAAFETYEAGPAVALRAEGVARFPPSGGLRLSRSVGEVVAAWP